MTSWCYAVCFQLMTDRPDLYMGALNYEDPVKYSQKF